MIPTSENPVPSWIGSAIAVVFSSERTSIDGKLKGVGKLGIIIDTNNFSSPIRRFIPWTAIDYMELLPR